MDSFIGASSVLLRVERRIREQLGRALGVGGFDPAADILGITVNRWPHGYAPEHNSLWEPELPEDQTPQVLGRARFGRIAIANKSIDGRESVLALDAIIH